MVAFSTEPRLETILSVHDRLLSLRCLCLQGRRVAFTQAFLTWRRQGLVAACTGTRGHLTDSDKTAVCGRYR